jgi:hypothetical protein
MAIAAAAGGRSNREGLTLASPSRLSCWNFELPELPRTD